MTMMSKRSKPKRKDIGNRLCLNVVTFQSVACKDP